MVPVAQLLGLALVHLIADVFAGLLPAILPAVRTAFGLSLTSGVALITILHLTCNGVQVLVGSLRRRQEKPLMIPLGLWLAAAVTGMGFLARSQAALPGLVGLVLVTGVGVAIIHPEGLRALHRLESLPPALGTSVFLVGGYCGFAGGAWLGAVLVSSQGLHGLLWLLLLPVLGSVLVKGLRIRLAVETAADSELPDSNAAPRRSFWPLFFMTVPIATGLTVFPSLLPTYLNEAGFALVAGGSAMLVFGAGIVGGSLFWGSVLRRSGQLRGATLTLLAGLPFLLLYVRWATRPGALWLLCAGAFWMGAPYPLLVSLARYARGPALGTRLAVIVGGTWGLASLVLLALGPVAERHGVQLVLYLGCSCFAVAAVVGLLLDRCRPGAGTRLEGAP